MLDLVALIHAAPLGVEHVAIMLAPLFKGAANIVTGGLIGGPPTPKLPPVPQITDPSVQAAALAQQAAAAQAAGRASTILTSGQGYTGATDVGKKVLLGG